MKLNLGSGYSGNDALFVITQTQKNDDWIFVDCAEHYRDAAKGCGRFDCYDFSEGIREPDASISHVWMGDVLEHVWKWRTRDVLVECFRVLIPGGQLVVSVPDMERVVRVWLESDGGDDGVADLIYGQQDARDRKNCEPDSHKNGFTQGSLTRLLQSVGFVGIERVRVHGTWYELAVSGRKPGATGG